MGQLSHQLALFNLSLLLRFNLSDLSVFSCFFHLLWTLADSSVQWLVTVQSVLGFVWIDFHYELPQLFDWKLHLKHSLNDESFSQ